MKDSKKKSEKRGLAVVTGASSGIGYELAAVFAKNGFDLLIAAENDGIEAAAGGFRSLGVEVTPLKVDLSKYDGVEQLYAKIKLLDRPVEVLALNAGVGVGGEFVETMLEQELNLIQLNIISLVHLTKRILPDMIAQGEGRLLFTSSIAATMPGPYFAVYAASKAFVQSFAQALRIEVKDKGVTVTALQPGPTDTNFFARAHMLDTKVGEGKKDDPKEVAEDAFAALMDGKDHIVAGAFKNKVQARLASVIPEPFAAIMQGKQAKPRDKSER